jgi:hypothetical protein
MIYSLFNEMPVSSAGDTEGVTQMEQAVSCRFPKAEKHVMGYGKLYSI